MIDECTYAFCFDDGLIRFGPKLPDDAHGLSHGTEEDMVIVRRLAHKDGNSFWVPGVRDDRDPTSHIERFADACMEHMDDGVTMYQSDRPEVLGYHKQLGVG